MNMTDESPKVETAIQKANDSIESIVKECGLLALRDQPVLIQTITLARGIKALQNVLAKEAVESYFVPLQNTALGFLTDKPEGYAWNVVRDCVIEAMLRGFRPIGNEMNIISGRFYGAKNGFERVVREYPDLSRLQYDLAVPVLAGDKGALVAFRASWFLAGEEMELIGAAPGEGQYMDTRIPVKVNSGMGPDAILGKATRKMFARIYNRISGVETIDGDPGDAMPATVLPAVAEPAQDGKRISLRGTRNGQPAAAPEASANDPKAQEEPGASG